MAGATLLTLAVVSGVTAWRQGQPLIEIAEREYDRQHYLLGGTPLQRDLAGGRYDVGTPVSNLIADHPPADILQGRRYTAVVYKRSNHSSHGARVIAKDGRVAHVTVRRSEVDALTISDALTPADNAPYFADMAVAVSSRREARMAVAGFAGTIEAWQLPP